VAAGAFLAENAVHVAMHPLGSPASFVSAQSGASSRDVQVKAADGAVLRGWLFVPKGPHPNYVILLHGVGDNRLGMFRIARMLLKDGYAVLDVDSRSHGESGGSLVTYGILEAPDVHAWADFLYATEPVKNLYGLGESMGAAVLLESLAVEPRFEAVVAESPFSTFDAIAHDRIYQDFHSAAWPVRALAGPIIFAGLSYARLRYHVDLETASPIEAVRRTSTPILLIHGLRDTNIYPQHSRDLLMANPRHITPWFVPKAKHTGALDTDPAAFEQRVTTFFEAHER
jgi:fermentation-respiration switch protein FrsA (DUF1100 family)